MEVGSTILDPPGDTYLIPNLILTLEANFSEENYEEFIFRGISKLTISESAYAKPFYP